MGVEIERIVKEKLDTNGRKSISYSQFSMWYKCPYSWKLSYIDKLKTYEPTIHLAFGTAIHEIIQTAITKYFKEGSAAADSIDIIPMFDEIFKRELTYEKRVPVLLESGEPKLDSNGKPEYSTQRLPILYTEDEYIEFFKNGIDIIEALNNPTERKRYFDKDKYELIGIEIPINMPIMNGLSFIGYIDIILKDKKTKKFRILDLKTATRMWNQYQQMDTGKIYQLLLYKAFYSKMNNIPLTQIDVEFIVLKRNLIENAKFPEKRIQRVVPSATKLMVNESVSSLVSFIRNGFSGEGEYNTSSEFRKNPHKGKTKYSNCKYCEFSCKDGGTCDRGDSQLSLEIEK